jgi:sugar lactone lactonase YvrE
MHNFLARWLLAMFACCAARAADDFWVPNSSWELLGQGYQLTADSAVDPNGIVYFSDAQNNRILKIDLAGKISVWKEDSHGTHGVAFGPDGRLYAGQHDRHRIVAFSPDGAETVITEGLQTHHLIVTSRNEIYYNEAPAHTVGMVDAAGRRRVVFERIDWPRGIQVFRDSVLAISDPHTRWVWTFDIRKDGSLDNGRPFYLLKTAEGSFESDVDGMTFDSQGFLYVATNIGVQVCDPHGPVIAVLDTPGGDLSAVFFGGPNLQWLYATDGNRIYRRLSTRRGSSARD